MGATAPRVLVVEDDDSVREIVAETVARAGYDVTTARHGAEAFDVVRDVRRRPSVVLLDLMMPVMDGWTFLSRIAAARVQVPVVVLSAVRDVRLPPSITVLPKPFRREQVLAAVAAHVADPKPPRVELAVYVADRCRESERTIETLLAVLGAYEPDAIQCKVHNIAEVPVSQLIADQVVTAPTLVMRRPLSLRFAGSMTDRRWLRTVLGIVEIERRAR